MGTIGHGYGSEWHLLRYLGYHRNALNEAILGTTEAREGAGKGEVEWLDFRFSYTRKALQDEREWGGVDFIAYPDLADIWNQYWPSRGPQWDTIGLLHGVDNLEEWLLVEAKAHLGEMESPWHAEKPASQAMIRSAMAATAKVVTHGGVATDAWLNKFYQYANRLAVLNFLSQTCTPAQPARLIFLYFYGETMPNRKCPQNPGEWQTHLDTVHSELDLDLQSPLMQRVHHVFVPVHPVVRKMSNLPLALAKHMVANGETEEVFRILLSEFETYKAKHKKDAMLTNVARQVEDKWRRCNPGEEKMERMRVLLEEYLNY